MSQVSPTLSALLLDDDSESEAFSALLDSAVSAEVVAARQPLPRLFSSNRRPRRRQEILSLREQVIALQEVLEAHATSDVGSLIPSGVEHKIQRARPWKAVALHQRDQRRTSEAERDRLRRKVKQQRHLIRTVARIVSKHSALELEMPPDKVFSRPTILPVGLGKEFEDISSHLPTMILQLNGLFMDPRFATHTGQLRDIRVMNEKTPNMTIETLNSRVVPFNLESTARAVWQFSFTKIERVTHWMEEHTEESDNSMCRTFEASFNFLSYQGVAEGRLAAWRIAEADRVVILQCVFVKNGTLHSGFENFSLRHFNWTVIRPPRNEQLRSRSHDTCQIDSFEVSIPSLTEEDGVGFTGSSEMMKEICIEAATNVLDVEREGVENILLEEQINRPRVVSTLC